MVGPMEGQRTVDKKLSIFVLSPALPTQALIRRSSHILSTSHQRPCENFRRVYWRVLTYPETVASHTSSFVYRPCKYGFIPGYYDYPNPDNLSSFGTLRNAARPFLSKAVHFLKRPYQSY